MEVLLDTSFIVSCVKIGIDFLSASEFGKLVLPEGVTDELIKLSEKGRGRSKEKALIALDIIRENKKKFKIIKLKGRYVDAGIVKYAEKKKIIVATLDKELKKKLKGNVRILGIRAKKKLALLDG